MKSKLIHFLNTYGNDFFHKLPKYKTAKYGNYFVSMWDVNMQDLTVSIGFQGEIVVVDLFDLDEFCL